MPGTEKKSKNSFIQYMKLLFVVSIMSCMVYFLVFNNIKSKRLDQKIKSTRKQLIKYANKSRNDIIRSEEILNSNKVKKIAREKLGMVNTKRDDYVILN
jgi:cell division protein FtsB